MNWSWLNYFLSTFLNSNSNLSFIASLGICIYNFGLYSTHSLTSQIDYSDFYILSTIAIISKYTFFKIECMFLISVWFLKDFYCVVFFTNKTTSTFLCCWTWSLLFSNQGNIKKKYFYRKICLPPCICPFFPVCIVEKFLLSNFLWSHTPLFGHIL